ncbi:flippase-like domain-containing protein [filamentous cyanobacterium LEGE 07170]|nr:flippase-like domain-containing protein [filamentous cyanobacterium LEGE 07170]
MLLKRLKPYLRWLILGAALFFLISTFRQHWREVAAIRLDAEDGGWLAIALLTTTCAHIWTGWVWGWILRELGESVSAGWSIRTYLITNIAKYLPGNVWHFYGRVSAVTGRGVELAIAIVSVVLEPLLMAAAALMVGLMGIQHIGWGLQLGSLAIALALVHPRLLNPAVQRLSRKKAQDEAASLALRTFGLQRYPWMPLLGELIFLALRGLGFLWIMLAFTVIPPAQVLPVISAFSFAWLLGLVVPGAPGGIGVFEATAIALLPPSFPPAVILSTVACYRLISTLAEAIGAAGAWLVSQRHPQTDPPDSPEPPLKTPPNQ